MCYDVFMRYFFSNSKTWILELEWHLFALIFLFGASYAFKEDRHVRVDLFYTYFSEKKKAWINLIGSAVLLMPWCFIVIWKSWTYEYSSWQIAEGSPQPGGLPARYLVKGAIALAFVLLFLQGLATIYHSIQILKSSKQ
ncbi:MAG: TRAP transporter small permease subunit [Bacteroidia bacterium]|nr:TRAP transporter small permease subunit [Bacteroidia bacterium]